MSYLAKFLELDDRKQSIGIDIWETVQNGNKNSSKKALSQMATYNAQDVVVTEAIYLKLRKYITSVSHLGAAYNYGKYSCPNCGNTHLKLFKTTVTPSGTIQRIMECTNDLTKFKISNTIYNKENK